MSAPPPYAKPQHCKQYVQKAQQCHVINSLKQTLHGKQTLLGKTAQLLTFSCQSRQYEAVIEGTCVSTYKEEGKKKGKGF